MKKKIEMDSMNSHEGMCLASYLQAMILANKVKIKEGDGVEYGEDVPFTCKITARANYFGVSKHLIGKVAKGTFYINLDGVKIG